MTMLPPLDYNDIRAVMEALVALNNELAASSRGFPAWFIAATQVMDHNAAMALLAGMTPQQVHDEQKVSFLLLGILAGREGWPLVGDTLPALVLPS